MIRSKVMSETAGKIMDPAVRLAEHHDLPDEELYTLITERLHSRTDRIYELLQK